ncbi:MAG: hypothetical protein SFX73_22690 [Kofleriaceae bacterium]|nr:hypothetical protein [Kofleriaceae bacterium]
MASTLPRFSSGLKIVRIGVIGMLLHSVATIVVTVMAVTADSPDESRKYLDYVKYLMLANVVAFGAMTFGVGRALPELKRARMDLRTMLISMCGFVVATLAMLWAYYVLSEMLDALAAHFQRLENAADLDGMLAERDRFETATERFASMGEVAVVKDLAYGAGLYFLTRTVQMSAAVNDQLALRDRAASMGRALMVMVVGDLFYQLTYGLGSGGNGFTALIASLLVAGYAVWCLIKLQRFLFDAAWFVNEPHNLPTATVVVREAAAPRASQPSLPKIPQPQAQSVPRPSQPSPIIVVPQPTAPTPRAESTVDGESDSGGPRFLR